MRKINKKVLYLDIDGVLLGKRTPDNVEIVLANYAKEFLEYCLRYYKCYWLTTHCRDGNQGPVINLFRKYADNDVMNLIETIKPAPWNTLKTEAIDFKSDFYWIDDGLLQSEAELLHKNNCYNKWIKVDTRANPDDLKRAMQTLRRKDNGSS